MVNDKWLDEIFMGKAPRMYVESLNDSQLKDMEMRLRTFWQRDIQRESAELDKCMAGLRMTPEGEIPSRISLLNHAVNLGNMLTTIVMEEKERRRQKFAV